jgi:hypothetical protein
MKLAKSFLKQWNNFSISTELPASLLLNKWPYICDVCKILIKVCMIIRKVVLYFYFILIPLAIVCAQNPGSPEDLLISNIRSDFDSLKTLKNDGAKRKLNAEIVAKLEKLLENPKSYHFGLDSLKSIGKVSAPDNSFRILNWNVTFDDFSYSYVNFMQLNPGGKYGYKLYQIKDSRLKIDKSIENQELTKDKWYGALIYKILLNSYKRQNYYTFFAIDHNNMMSHFKFIDVITFNDKGEPLFGKPIFKTPKALRSRVVFEFSAQLVMGLKYDEKLKMIVFDHLSPDRPELAGDFKFYGPDFSYDGFRFEDGLWQFQTDLKLINAPPVIKK